LLFLSQLVACSNQFPGVVQSLNECEIVTVCNLIPQVILVLTRSHDLDHLVDCIELIDYTTIARIDFREMNSGNLTGFNLGFVLGFLFGLATGFEHRRSVASAIGSVVVPALANQPFFIQIQVRHDLSSLYGRIHPRLG